MTDYVTVSADAPQGRDGAIKLWGREAFEACTRPAGWPPRRWTCWSRTWCRRFHREINRLVHDFIVEHGGVPATLGYRGYAHSTCVSINHVVCHGIPSDKALKSGDIVNVDVTRSSMAGTAIPAACT
ncbi:Methionine aminopeptidase [Sphingomonas paucimobilis]|nr:Methionine aminopeptidase [Sphingomonas paucimobilis]